MMKTIVSLRIPKLFFTYLLLLSTSFIFGQVGINTTSPAEMLDVNGNVKIDGALMPGNQAGSVDQILLSQGAGTPAAWGPGFINTSEIANIAKFYIGPLPAIADGTYLILNVPDASMTAESVIEVNFTGAMPVGPIYGYNFTVHALPEAGQANIYVTNVSGGAMSAGVGLNVIIYYK